MWRIPLTLVGIALVVLIGWFINNSLNSPLRTLRAFPVEDYYDNYASLEGGRFKAELKVINSIGWKDKVGRLVTFSVGSGEKPIVVLIPPEFDNTQFDPGQKFSTGLFIGEGGLVKATFLQKE